MASSCARHELRSCQLASRCAGGTRLRLFAMLFREYPRRQNVRNGGLELIVPAADHVTFAFHHGAETSVSDLGRIILLTLPYLSIKHIGTRKKVSLRSAGH